MLIFRLLQRLPLTQPVKFQRLKNCLIGSNYFRFNLSIMSAWSLPNYSCASHNAGKRNGQIQLILGPMFSGKSTELVRRIRRYQIADNKCLVIKYAKDSR